MMPERIADASDPRVCDYARLTDVAWRSRTEPEHGMFVAEGAKVIRRAVDAGYPMRSILGEQRRLDELGDLVEAAARRGCEVLLAEPEVLEAVTGYRVHRGALAVMERRPLPDPADLLAHATRVAVLEDIVDHTNVGAVFRSAAALGVDAVLVTPRCADPLYRRSVRVSMGTVLAIPWTRIAPWPGGVDLLRAHGFVVAGLALDADGSDLDTFASTPPTRVALVLGAEGDGLAPRTMRACDLTVRIPMRAGVDSLNVAAAAAVAFWELRAR